VQVPPLTLPPSWVQPAPRPRRGRVTSSGAPRRDLPREIGTPLANRGLHRGRSPAIAGDRITPNCLSPGSTTGFQAAHRSFNPMVVGSSPTRPTRNSGHLRGFLLIRMGVWGLRETPQRPQIAPRRGPVASPRSPRRQPGRDLPGPAPTGHLRPGPRPPSVPGYTDAQGRSSAISGLAGPLIQMGAERDCKVSTRFVRSSPPRSRPSPPSPRPRRSPPVLSPCGFVPERAEGLPGSTDGGAP